MQSKNFFNLGRMSINPGVFHAKYWSGNDREKGILIDSQFFGNRVRYVVKGDSLILLSSKNGIFAFKLAAGKKLLEEVGEIIAVYDRSGSQ